MLRFLKKCQAAYEAGKPLISDEEFDYLARKHKFYEVGAPATTNNKVQHLYRMYSLKKVFDDDEKDLASIYMSPIISPKLDGAAVELVYEDGHLIQASTRGDGIIGDDILELMLELDSIQNTIPVFNTLQITGEIVAPESIENARNYAAGALHLKNIEEFKSRDIRFVAYGLQPLVKDSTYLSDMKILTKYGFSTVVSSDWRDYPQDGLVYRENSNLVFEELGYTARHPKGAIAYKVRSDVETKEAELLKVDWQLGKGKKLTPVAIFTPVKIEGATISRATLHNAGFVEDLDLSIGDTVLVTRSGGVIPKIVGKL